MIRIRKPQIEAMTGEMRKADDREIAQRLRSEHADRVGHMSPAELAAFVEQGREDADALGISAKDDVYRYLRLHFRVEAIRQSPFLSGVVLRVLSRVDLAAVNRLNFIEQQVLPRASSGQADAG